MDKLGELLNVLKENKLDKTYNRIMTDLADIKSALSVVNEEVNDAILALLSEGKYEDVNKLTSIPAMSSNFVIRMNDLFSFELTDCGGISQLPLLVEKEEDKKETVEVCTGISVESKLPEIIDDKSDIKEEEVLEYQGIITSIKGLRKGSKVLHKSFGIGKVVSLEDGKNDQSKILRVLFEAYGEKPFSCTPDILLRYFGIESNESNNDEKVQNNEDGYVKQEINVDNRVKKNSNEELKYYLEPPKYFKNLFRKIETIILRQHMSVQKEQMPESYKYTLFGNRVCYVNFRNKYLNLYFNIPYGEMEDKKGLLEKNNSHQVHVPYKLKVDNTVSLEDIESYIIQAFNYYK